jgi:hypothetical protein
MEAHLGIVEANLERQRWAKWTTLRALKIFSETLFQVEKRFGGWNGA